MESTAPRRRPRFSLLTLLLTATIVAMAIVIAKLWHEVGPLQADVRRLRADAGELTVNDPEKIYAIVLDDELEKHTWKWRIYLPKSRQYEVHVGTSRIPATGAAHSNCSSTIEGGEYLLTVGLRWQQDGQWAVVTRWKSAEDANPSVTFEGHCGLNPTSDWLVKGRGVQTSGVIGRGQAEFQADEPLELLRRRAMVFTPKYPTSEDSLHTHAGTSTPTVGPSDGFLIWLEPVAP